jgi:hypothetical protein
LPYLLRLNRLACTITECHRSMPSAVGCVVQVSMTAWLSQE